MAKKRVIRASSVSMLVGSGVIVALVAAEGSSSDEDVRYPRLLRDKFLFQLSDRVSSIHPVL